MSSLPGGAAAVLAAEDPRYYEVSPGLLGFIAFAALGIVTGLLLWSMSRRLRRIDPTLPREAPPRRSGEPGPDGQGGHGGHGGHAGTGGPPAGGSRDGSRGGGEPGGDQPGAGTPGRPGPP